MKNVAERTLKYVAKRERSNRFHSSSDINETFHLDFDEAREIIDGLSNMELLELIEHVTDEDA